MPQKKQSQKRQRDECKFQTEAQSADKINELKSFPPANSRVMTLEERISQEHEGEHLNENLDSPKEQSTERDDSELKEAKLLCEGEKLSGQKLKDFLKKNFLDFADEQEANLFAHVDPELLK